MTAHNRKRHSVCISAFCLLYLACIMGAASCQQPVSKPASAVHSKSSKKNSGDNNPLKEKKTKKDEALHRMILPNTLSKKPADVKEQRESEMLTKTTDPELNEDGLPVKYEEKEVSYTISAALGDNLLLDPEYTKIYPGAVLVGDSIDEGSYKEILQGKKRDALISFSLQGLKGKNGEAGKTSGTIKPDLAAYRELHNEILSQKITSTASARSSYEEILIKSESSFDAHLKLGVGFGVGRIKNKIGGGFKFKKGDKKHRHLIRFTETFYTADVNEDTAPMMTDIPREVLGSTMPVYVSSVSYGRIAYLFIESDKSWQELKPYFNTAFKVKPFTVDNKVELALAKLDEMTHTTIHIIGGSKKSVTTLGQFKDYIVNGGFSSNNPGQIIKYKLKFLSDNSLAHIKYKEKYQVTERTPITAKGISISARMKSITGTKNMKVFGTIALQRQNAQDNKQMLFDKSKAQAVSIQGNQILQNEIQPAKTITDLTGKDEVALVFDIRESGWFPSETFYVTNTDKQANEPIVYKVKDLMSGGSKKIVLYQKGNTKEKITVDILFVSKNLF
ncbi:MAG: thiol-activated cytolysin family protein [Treponema sp.]